MRRTLDWSRASPLSWLTVSCLIACATGVEGNREEFDPRPDASAPIRDGGTPRDASVPLPAPDAQPLDATNATDGASEAAPADTGTPELDAQQPDADATLDTGPATPDATDEGPEAGPDAMSDADAMPEPDSAVDANTPEAATPIDCSRIARSGVQLCDMSADTCGAVFTNSAGCTAVCSAAGLVCASAYENVENRCARDDTRPALACDSGHQSDYCACRRGP